MLVIHALTKSKVIAAISGIRYYVGVSGPCATNIIRAIRVRGQTNDHIQWVGRG